MKLQAIKGELAFATLFAAVGLVWIVKSFDFAFWTGFAPDSGFMPVICGALLLILSLGVLVTLFVNPPVDVVREPLGKPLKLLGAVVLTVASLGFLGFAAPLFLMMFFMFAHVEGLAVLKSAIVSAAVTAVFLLVFEHWLGVPVPVFPWSF